MSISSVAASIAALRQQPTPPVSNGATTAQPVERPREHHHNEGRAPLVTASGANATSAAGALLNTVV